MLSGRSGGSAFCGGNADGACSDTTRPSAGKAGGAIAAGGGTSGGGGSVTGGSNGVEDGPSEMPPARTTEESRLEALPLPKPFIIPPRDKPFDELRSELTITGCWGNLVGSGALSIWSVEGLSGW